MVTGLNSDGHFTVYINVKLLCHTHETSITLYVSYKKRESKNKNKMK